jgi:hypothetical protein
MSAAAYFIEKCVKKTQESISFAIQKLSDPASMVQVDASSALKEASKGNFGPLADSAGDYLSQNADALLLTALKVTGLENKVLDALNLFYNMLAQAISAYNDLILLFMKRIAENILVALDDKEAINQKMKQALTNLHNALKAISTGDPVFDKYIAQLRAALIELDSGRQDIQVTRNTLASSDRFLSKRYKSGKAKIDDALSKIKPLDDNPYLSPSFKGVLANVGIQTDKQQINNILAIPRLCKDVISASQGYIDKTVAVNALLQAYYLGLSQLQAGIPQVMKKYILSRFDTTLVSLSNLVRSMALTLNGAESQVAFPQAGYKVTPVTASVLAFKWAMDGSLINESFKLIPAGHVVVSRRANAGAPPFISGNPLRAGTSLVAGESGDFKKVNVNDTVTIFANGFSSEFKVVSIVDTAEIILNRKINASGTPKIGVDYEITNDALGALQLNFDVVDAYQTSVKKLKLLGNISNGSASLLATEAQENFVPYAGQLLTFLLEATGAATSGKIRAESLSLCRSFIRRCDLVTARDAEIRVDLLAFINKPIPLEDTLKRIHDGLQAALRGLGLDRAADLLDKGDFASFFKLNGKNATYVGAALEAIALLKDCFDNEADRARLSEVENNVQGDAELLNFRISFNFDLAIFKNLKDCLNLNALADLFNAKEILCGLLEDAGVGSLFTKLNDILSF